jgi:hypothetical protein
MTERSLQCRDAVQKLRGVLDAQLLDVIVNYIGELQSSLKSAEQLVATMLEAQEQLSHEAKAELNALASLAAEQILDKDLAVETWRKRATRLRSSVDSLKCVVCMERVRNVVIKPCAHLALCDACCKRIDASSCPICRAPASGVDIVFTP